MTMSQDARDSKKIIYKSTLMKKCLSILVFFCGIMCLGQTTDKDLILLAEIFHKHHSTTHIQSLDTSEFVKMSSCEGDSSKDFILELIKRNNQTLSDKYLKKPNLKTLKSIYTIVNLNYNMFSEKPIKNSEFIKKLNIDSISENELLVSYYKTLFGNLVNKMDVIDFSTINFNFKNLNLVTKAEKGIFFLVVMERLGGYYWGNEKMSETSNSDEINILIGRYPKFEDKKYYEFKGFDFEDFKLIIDIRKPKESFKNYYLNCYINILEYHFGQLIENKSE